MGKTTDMNNRVRKIALGTLIAGAMGYVAGILTAPQSGRDTRTYLSQSSVKARREAEKQLKKLHTELSHLLDETKSKVQDHLPENADEIVAQAGRARQKAREILSAIHDGSADDHDLDRAVTEAGKAIASIRSYLKK